MVHRYVPESDCDAVSEHVAICFDRLISNIYRLFCARGDKCLFVLTSSRTTFYQTRVLSMPSLVTNWLSMKYFSDKFLYHTTKLQNYVCVGANCSTRELCFYKLLWLIFLFPQINCDQEQNLQFFRFLGKELYLPLTRPLWAPMHQHKPQNKRWLFDLKVECMYTRVEGYE